MNTFFFILGLFLIGYVLACILWTIITTIAKKDKESKITLSDKTEKKILIALTIFIIIIIYLAENEFFSIQNAVDFFGN